MTQRILALDLSTRDVGWACLTSRPVPFHGAVECPGISSLGKLFVATRNLVESLVVEYEPQAIVFCMALFRDQQTAARALAGVQSITELVAEDNSIACHEAIESRVRKEVLGRGTFQETNPNWGKVRIVRGKPDPNGERDMRRWINGSKNAKEAAFKWCRDQGLNPVTHDEADALVLLEYTRRQYAAGRVKKRIIE